MGGSLLNPTEEHEKKKMKQVQLKGDSFWNEQFYARVRFLSNMSFKH